MLGDRARVIAMPTLEITADNIVCSHGASIADVDPNAMFYITSRGLSPVVSEHAYDDCFCQNLIGIVNNFTLSFRLLEKCC